MRGVARRGYTAWRAAGRRGTSLRARRSVARGVLHLAGEVELLAEVVHQRELRLQVVDVVLLVGEDLLEQPLAGVVADLLAVADRRAQPIDDLDLDRHVGLELLADRLPHAEREQALVVRQALEEEDAVGEPLSVG